MESILPSYKDFIQIEKGTLKLIYSYLSKWPLLASFAGIAQRCLYAPDSTRFVFHNCWDTEYEDISCRVFIGAEVNKQDKGLGIADMSYCICIFEVKDKPVRVLRKFHFDYVTYRPDRRHPHPRFHLQYAGGLPPELRTLGVTQELIDQLQPSIERPRIFCAPMTIGLLMNLAFHEFPCAETKEILERGEWRNLVCENQKRILAPFYKRCRELTENNKIPFYDKAYVWPKATYS